jgi:hypothetical protein
MHGVQNIATSILGAETNLPDGSGGEWVVWVLMAGAIVALWLLIRNTRKRAYRDYWDRKRAEDERRRNDPDMKNPDD